MTAETTEWAGPARFLPPPEPIRRDDGARHYSGVTYAVAVRLPAAAARPVGAGRPRRRRRWSSGSTAAAGCSATAATCRRRCGPNQVFDALLDAGLAVATIDYRHALEAPFPAQLHDAKAAVRYLRAHADELGISTERIGVMGRVGRRPPRRARRPHRAPRRPRGQPRRRRSVERGRRRRRLVRPRRPHDHAADDAAAADRGQARRRNCSTPPEDQPDRAAWTGAARADASPITHVTPDAPPFLLVHGTADWLVPYAQSEQLHAALTARRGRLPARAGRGRPAHLRRARRHRRRRPAVRRLPRARRSPMSDLTVLPVTVEHHREPLGIGETHAAAVVGDPAPSCPTGGRPPTSWRSSRRTAQAWSSGRVDSAESVLVPWGAPPLTSRERRTVRVRVWGEGAAEPSAWSEDVVVEAGLLEPADWTAELVQPLLPEPGGTGEPVAAAAPRVRARPAGRPGPAVRHRAGRLRGRAERRGRRRPRAGPRLDQLPPPAALPDLRRHRPARRGRATRSACTLADGWYRGYLGFTGKRHVYGDRTGAFVQLEVEHPDGTRTVVTTDGSWRSTLGPDDPGRHLQAARPSTPAASCPAGRRPASTTPTGRRWRSGRSTSRTLVAPTGPPVRRTQTLPVAGDHHLAVGQDAGRLRPEPRRPASGSRCPTGRPAPRSPSGTPRCSSTASWAPARCARPTRPTSSSSTATGPRTWEPRFTFHGFRYAEVTGWPGELTADDLEAVVVHTDLRRTGTFTCSDPDVEPAARERRLGHARQLRRPARPTARSATSGWAGPATCRSSRRRRRSSTTPPGMLRSWLADLAVEQLEDHDGIVPIFVPFLPLLPFPLQAEVGWGDAAVVVPWVLYERHGDARPARRPVGQS